MNGLRSAARRVPFLPDLYRQLRRLCRGAPVSADQVFTSIYNRNGWGGRQSVSGRGSDTDQVQTLVQTLPRLLREFGVRTLLDIPCGDFHWMKGVDLDGIDYTGADIVEALTADNQTRYARDGVRFVTRNLITGPLPAADLVFCRDCLVHFSFADIFKALRTLADSPCTWLLATTFTDRTGNRDITTGEWRPLALDKAPFLLPPPVRLLHEGCTENGGLYQDKALGLWRMEDIRPCVR